MKVFSLSAARAPLSLSHSESTFSLLPRRGRRFRLRRYVRDERNSVRYSHIDRGRDAPAQIHTEAATCTSAQEGAGYKRTEETLPARFFIAPMEVCLLICNLLARTRERGRRKRDRRPALIHWSTLGDLVRRTRNSLSPVRSFFYPVDKDTQIPRYKRLWRQR